MLPKWHGIVPIPMELLCEVGFYLLYWDVAPWIYNFYQVGHLHAMSYNGCCLFAAMPIFLGMET